ncbi:GDP-mannose mannosyl hydrolase [Thermodesulfatator autotrophicus]|uniref:GDP-mannose mannosyl hydrolase n=1 Tax=Thermodesulfatator autotrophicus TaxID=1795632 RepID=A0A177E5M3_9BACT|nr:GDP-mannose mannosyl hydrolase [Thermodesulfatator autotrophicus]OAG27016.1 GDP-mannose mannosyl hydrolase [Thermodesulfatator autotrophicus]
MWLDEETFKCIVAHAPLVSIDLIVENGEGKILVGRRKNPPAKGFLFVPGGRIFKNETIEEAFRRITFQELGKEIDAASANFWGVYEHFYKDSFFGDEFSTHYVVLAYKLKVTDSLPLLNSQHSEYLWLRIEELLNRKDVHVYAKAYFRRGQ